MIIWFLCICIILILFIFMLKVLRISFTLNYTYKQDEHVLILACHLYKLQVFKKKKIFQNTNSIWKWLDDLEQFQHQIRSTVDTFKEWRHIAFFLFERAQIKHLHWHTEMGTTEPNHTGLVVGGMWNFKSIVIRFINNNTSLLHHPVITIHPLFKKQYFCSTFTCILTMNLGKAIYILLKMRKNETVNRVFRTTGGS